MAKAIGIGGIFLHFNGDKAALFDWYEKNLGLEFSRYGTGFLSGEQLMVLTMKRDNTPNFPYLNFRVDDIESLVKHLKNESTTILADVKDYGYGKFATFKDPFDNVIELWEADEKTYQSMVLEEIKKYNQKKQSQ